MLWFSVVKCHTLKVVFMKMTIKSHKQQLEAFRSPLVSAIADFRNPP